MTNRGPIHTSDVAGLNPEEREERREQDARAGGDTRTDHRDQRRDEEMKAAAMLEGDPAPTDSGAPRGESTRRSEMPPASAGVQSPPTVSTNGEGENVPLISGTEHESLTTRWTDIQSRFVDDPRNAVEQADSLVAEVIQSVASSFARERTSLEKQWETDGEAETEDLRIALQRYRSFFQRLLAA
jgi:hypothetical protein